MRTCIRVEGGHVQAVRSVHLRPSGTLTVAQGTRLSLLCWDPSRPPTKKPQVDFICYLTGSMTRQCHRGRKDVPALAQNLGQVDLKHCRTCAQLNPTR